MTNQQTRGSLRAKHVLLILLVLAQLVAAIQCEKEEDTPDAGTISKPTSIPEPPTDLTALATQSYSVELTWRDNSSNETGFRLFRQTGGFGRWDMVGALGVNERSFTDTTVTPSTQYTYRVAAYSAAGTSRYSNELSLITAAVAVRPPTGLAAIPVSISQLSLKWQDNSLNEEGFKIERRGDLSSPWSLVGTTKPNSATFQDTGLGCNTQYYYRVYAFNTEAKSITSNEVAATTPQSSWSVEPSRSRAELWSVGYSEVGVGIAVGVSGAVTRTLNGGITWAPALSKTVNDLFGIHLITPENAIAVGRFGTITQTADAGATWALQPSGTTNELKAIHFFDENVGVIVGTLGVILTTTDGGASWVPRSSGTNGHLLDVQVTSATNAVVVGANGLVLRTANGGATWTKPTSGTTTSLRGVAFISPTVGCAVGGAGTIIRTTNGGITWAKAASGTANELWGITKGKGNSLTAVGIFGTILYSANGGINWAKQTSPTLNNLRSVAITPEGTGVATGSGGTAIRLRICQ